MTANLKSTLRAATLSLALAFGMTAGHVVLTPDTAQAGVIGGIKKAASTVGGAVKKAAVTVGGGAKKVAVGDGSGAKRVAVGVGSAGKKVGVAIGRDVKRGVEAIKLDKLGSFAKRGVK